MRQFQDADKGRHIFKDQRVGGINASNFDTRDWLALDWPNIEVKIDPCAVWIFPPCDVLYGVSRAGEHMAHEVLELFRFQGVHRLDRGMCKEVIESGRVLGVLRRHPPPAAASSGCRFCISSLGYIDDYEVNREAM